MLLEVAYKIIVIIMHSRLLPIQEGLDHEPQFGFRPERGCTDAIYTVKIALKKRREHGKESWVFFLDLVKAFDRVQRELLWEILKRFGVPNKLISLLKTLHNNFEVKFTADENTHTIPCTIGVKQGDILGPILFTFFLAAVMITWRATTNIPLCIFRTKNGRSKLSSLWWRIRIEWLWVCRWYCPRLRYAFRLCNRNTSLHVLGWKFTLARLNQENHRNR